MKVQFSIEDLGTHPGEDAFLALTSLDNVFILIFPTKQSHPLLADTKGFMRNMRSVTISFPGPTAEGDHPKLQ